MRCGEWVPLPTGPEERSGEEAMPPAEEKRILHLKWRVLVLSGTFRLCPCQKNVELSARSDGDLVDIEDVLLGNSEYSVRIMWLISFYCITALYCKQSVVFEILKHNKIWRTMLHHRPSLQILGGLVPPFTPMRSAMQLVHRRHWSLDLHG